MVLYFKHQHLFFTFIYSSHILFIIVAHPTHPHIAHTLTCHTHTQSLFNDIQYSQLAAIPPDNLRQSMALCYKEQRRFQLGLMDDVAECFVSHVMVM